MCGVGQELSSPERNHGAGGDFQAKRVERVGPTPHGLHQLQILRAEGNG